MLTAGEIRSELSKIHAAAKVPSWMALDFVSNGTSLVAPVEEPLVSAGSRLEIVAGIGDRAALYAGYWRLVAWIAAVILMALATALIGIWLVQRMLARERRVSELKSQFVASVSHELRTPVASMRLMADALDAGKVDGAAAKEFHRLMSQEGARLSALIENVLDFARIEEGRKGYRFAPADLAALVEDTIQLMRPVAEQREVTISGTVASVSGVEVDRAAIEQALINLIDNAIKFSPAGGEVAIALATTQDGWQLSVADNGAGIPRAERQRVFERFTRLGNELRRETQGTGIGLSIVRHIVEAHGASIQIDDNTPRGTTFVIRSSSGRKKTEAAAEPTVQPELSPEPCDS